MNEKIETARGTMIKLLLADDEEYTRDGLIEEIDWENLGIDEVMQAQNGAEALGIAGWYKPDIILTDIKMPKMDGIEFAKELVSENQNVKIIFMSGFMEVEYLKSAIRLSAIDYIEKPIDLKVVEKALEKAVNEIHEKKAQSDILNNQKNYEQKQLSTVLTSKLYDNEIINKLCEKLSFPKYVKYKCILLGSSGRADTNELRTKAEAVVAKRKVKYLISDIDSETIQLILAYDDKNRYIISGILSELSGIREDVLVAVGMESDNLSNIYGSRQTAELALGSSFFDTSRKVYAVDEYIFNRKTIEPQLYGDYLLLLKENPKELINWAKELKQQIREQKYYRKEQIRLMICSFLMSMQQEYPGIYLADSSFASEEAMMSHINEYRTFDKLWDFFEEKIMLLQKEVEGTTGYSKLIVDIIDYIDKGYSRQDLGVAEIAARFKLTPSYINVLFKDETGSTIKKYISSVRLENAKQMLRQGYDKITNIAERCGYANANYFAKVFREETGMTPLEYRKML